MFTSSHYVLWLLVVISLCQTAPLQGQDKILLDKKDADYVFSLTRPEWEAAAKKFFRSGWNFRVIKLESGSGVLGTDPATGIGLAIQPFYTNDHDPPDGVVVGNYFPIGHLPPMTPDMKSQMETQAQKDLGQTYDVSLTYSKMEKIELLEFFLTTRK